MKKRAFTLIELIVSLAIISLISSIILIKSGVIPKLQERKEMENLQADINYCREKSLVTGFSYEIEILKDSYQIRREDDNKFVKEVYFKHVKANVDNIFVFRPTGSVRGASKIYFTSKNNEYSIIVAPIAGRIRNE
ncbi:prepilin-type N-terminal cleavage/methylation domain-containing protein [Anaerococcus rubeinfantis]|uniref:prepilin-type N-terminal cleavage/methylation domain-containing protein n=1 Tax=Anaerococcus rubeinfantis TaxID=1720199 RepID=UPI00073F7CAA|nr:prepilin-type N-terminal cleavage/methylation domain-containing protein [Anaerococcus rubeinfantis]